MPLKFSYLLALFCTGLLLFICSNFNLGITPDSISYIDVAQNLVQGQGFVDYEGNLVQHWPPGYPLALAFFAKLYHVDVMHIGKVLNAVLLLLSGILFAHCLEVVKVKPRVNALFTAFFLISVPLIYFYYFLSEGLFITLLMAVILLFLKYVKRPKRSYLILAGILCGLLMITRYSGIGFILGFTAVLMFFPGSKFINRVISVFLYGIPIVLIFGCWLWYANQFTDLSSSRTLSWHPISFAKLTNGIYSFLSWFNYPKLIFGLIIISVIYCFYDKFSLKKFKGLMQIIPKHLYYLLLLPIITYLTFIVISISLIYDNIPLNNRILSPIFPSLFLLLTIVSSHLINYTKGKRVVGVLFILLTINVFLRIIPIYLDHFKEGKGYSNHEWQNSESLDYARGVDQKMIYTNSPEILTHHNIYSVANIPFLFSPGTTIENSRKKQDIINLKDQIRDEEAQIIFFNQVNWRDYIVSREELLQLFEGEEIVYFKDGFCIR